MGKLKIKSKVVPTENIINKLDTDFKVEYGVIEDTFMRRAVPFRDIILSSKKNKSRKSYFFQGESFQANQNTSSPLITSENLSILAGGLLSRVREEDHRLYSEVISISSSCRVSYQKIKDSTFAIVELTINGLSGIVINLLISDYPQPLTFTTYFTDFDFDSDVMNFLIYGMSLKVIPYTTISYTDLKHNTSAEMNMSLGDAYPKFNLFNSESIGLSMFVNGLSIITYFTYTSITSYLKTDKLTSGIAISDGNQTIEINLINPLDTMTKEEK